MTVTAFANVPFEMVLLNIQIFFFDFRLAIIPSIRTIKVSPESEVYIKTGSLYETDYLFLI